MNPGPQLRRSLTFWAGLITILFICFAWWDSRSHITLVHWKQVEVNSTLHGLLISRIPPWKEPLHFRRRDRGPDSDLALFSPFDPPFLVRKKTTYEPHSTTRSPLEVNQQGIVDLFGPGTWILHLPYWLIVLPLLLTWNALLIARARRRKRSITHAPS
ncbi:MAG: hypothetical protein EOP87_14020 [Verrucomicrobiaceae bacterium]|nr:MAG: hypothetical protein EOP87_14020 [Verrucomicrobiaceae bacterium]